MAWVTDDSYEVNIGEKGAATYTVTVRVYDAMSGRPIEGATVLVDGSKVGTTNSSGEVVTEVKEGTHKFTAKYDPYYEPESKKVSVTSDMTVTFSLMPA